MRLIHLLIIGFLAYCRGEENVKVFTVATEKNDGFIRFIRSANQYGIDVEVLGMGTEWKGGDTTYTSGGYKVNLLKKALDSIEDKKNTIILFVDGYDVVFTSPLEEIISKFKKFDAKILFGAEHYCWPDESLASQYPEVAPKAPRFLNSGMFIGYTSSIRALLKNPIKDTDDDQLYYTKTFLNTKLRSELGMKLDEKSEIFQNINGALNSVKLNIDPETTEGTLTNTDFSTIPSVIHGNGINKSYLNAFANYLAGTFKNKECKICQEDLMALKEEELPTVLVALFVKRPVPFLEEFLEKITKLNYPKNKIHLFIHNNEPYHEEIVKDFVEKSGKEYKGIKLISPKDEIDERAGRKLSVNQAEVRECDYYFSVDADAHLDDKNTLFDLLTMNRSFIAPILIRPNELWSNFWGALNENGYYARSHDYLDIIKGTIQGMWNMPFVSSCYLVKRNVLPKLKFDHKATDPDMAMCENLRKENVFMYVTNMKEYGHLVNYEDYNIKLKNPDFYMLLSNEDDWEKRYIHPEYQDQLKPNFTHKQPCPDVYWFPIGTKRFCKEMVEIMENFGKWSDGSNKDKRLEGGYEAVPTRDIHMNQVGLEAVWLRFLKLYVRPLQETVYLGYFHDPPRSLMNFVVRYRPDEQPSLRPHHDSSTYTINIALNEPGKDYKGGGCHFLRYNCSVTNTKMGWMLMHPGRLTHFHEGLRVTEGTRYIMISFVDP